MVEASFTEVIADTLYFVSLHSSPASDDATHYFTIDQELAYKPYFADFGPMNLAQVHQYVGLLQGKLDDAKATNARVVHVSSHDLRDRSNAAFLVCAFLVIQHGHSAEEAFRAFADRYPPLLPFRDASYGSSTFDLTVLDCLEGLSKALQFGWHVPKTFDAETYNTWAEPAHGGMNWIIPGKLLAFLGPCANRHGKNKERCSPKDYLRVFREAGVLLVIRLNSKEYDGNDFISQGIRHVDMHFPDGSCPPPEIMERFISIVGGQPGAVAVHCRAGLGRTGVLAGLYMMRHYAISARAAMGWCRLCRPGSLLGAQQQFLCDMEEQMAARRTTSARDSKPFTVRSSGRGIPDALRNVASPSRSTYVARQDAGQGEWLVSSLMSGPLERPVPREGVWQRLWSVWQPDYD